MNKKFYIMFSLQILIALLIASYFLIDFKKLDFFNDTYTYQVQKSECDLTKSSCEISLNSTQKISLSITPKDIVVMKPLDFIIKANQINEDFLDLKIYATNMDMGTQILSAKKIGKDKFNTKVILPTCITGNMIWNVDITSKSFHKNQAVKFIFKTK